jgi:hypothetical protein
MAVAEADLQAVEQTLIARGAHVQPHARWSLLAHLTATFRILEQWNQPAYVQYAGLIHSVYSTDRYKSRLFRFAEREILRSVCGEQAERLAYLFCSLPRRELFRLATSALGRGPEHYQVPDRRGDGIETISAVDLRDLVVIHIANSAEQSAKKTGEPAAWLADASEIAMFTQPFDHVPPIFNNCERIVERDDEQALLKSYERALHVPDESRALELAFSAAPWVAEPAIWLGICALSEGDADTAARYGAQAGDLIEAWNTAWDKRLSEVQWLALAGFLEGCKSVRGRDVRFVAKSMRQILRTTSDRPTGIFGRLAAVGAVDVNAMASVDGEDDEDFAVDEDLDTLPRRFVEYASGFRDNVTDPRMGMYPGLTEKPFWDPQDFPLVHELERLAPRIIDEFQCIPPEAFHRESERIKREGDWSVFLLYERGKRQDVRCALVPETTRVVQAHRTMRTMNGLIYFSRMAPDTIIARHKGPTNLRLRCHLGIDIPSDCGIEVGGECRTWEVGKCLVFDDSFPHQAWNRSDRERVVLIVDIWHPDLSDDEILLLQGMDRHVQLAAEGLQKYWQGNERALAALM